MTMTVGLFWTIFAGFIIGMLMNAFKPVGSATGLKGFAITIGIGIAGALAVSFAGQAMGFYGREQLHAFLAALVGAAVVLGIWRLVGHKAGKSGAAT